MIIRPGRLRFPCKKSRKEECVRYLLIDRITEVEKGNRILGIKNVAMSEDVLEHHFPKNPIMPGVLLLEAMVQLAGWLEAASSRFESWFLLDHVGKCRFYETVLPGDQVILEVRALPTGDASRRAFKGTGSVAGGKKTAADFQGIVVPLETLTDPDDHRRLFDVLSRSSGAA
jgi:3-hydroxyacyl-[acyl-carrier-protein] dehydratase